MRHRCARLSNAGVIHFGDYRTAGLQKQHCNSIAALREQFFELDILWAGCSEI